MQQKEEIGELLPAEILFDVDGENIRFADLLSYTTKLAAKAGFIKAPVPVSAIPSMTLHKLWGYIALVDTRIADEEYKAGIGLQVETELWGAKAGFRVRINDMFILSGWGYLPHINITSKDGKDAFRLQGLTPDKGPRLSFYFDPREPQKGIFIVNGALIIPALGLHQMVDLKWYHYWLEADFESKFAGFSVLFGLRMNLKAEPPPEALFIKETITTITAEEETVEKIKRPMTDEEKESMTAKEKEEEAEYSKSEKWRQLYVKFGFKDDFAEYLNEQLVPAIRSLKKKSIERLDKLSSYLAHAQERSEQATEQEIEKTKEQIAATNQEIEALQAECAKASGMQLIRCKANIQAKKAKVQGKKFYVNALLRPKKAVIRGTGALTVAHAKGLRKATEVVLEGTSKGLEFLAAGIKLLRVKEALGEYSYRDMISLKLPRLVRLVLELNIGEESSNFVLEDIQFDFNNPKGSVAQIFYNVLQAWVENQNEKYAPNVAQLAAP